MPLFDGPLVPMIVFFDNLSSLNLLLQLIQTPLLIVLSLHFCSMFISSFLPGPQILSNAADLFLQLHFLSHECLLAFVPDADLEVFTELLRGLFEQRLLMKFL